MHDLVVYGGADAARESAVALEAGLGSVLPDEALDRLVNLLRARSRLSKRPRKAQGPL